MDALLLLKQMALLAAEHTASTASALRSDSAIKGFLFRVTEIRPGHSLIDSSDPPSNFIWRNWIIIHQA
jgi:hypothetical protein